MSLKKRNLLRNRAAEKTIPCGMICGQGTGIVSGMKYGLCGMNFNGCECIAVYNALLFLNRPKPLSLVVLCMERYKMLFGIFGGNPFGIAKALGRLGENAVRTDNFMQNGGYILSFWTKKPFLSSLHTVFIIKRDIGITVFNRYNNSSAPSDYVSVEDMLGKRRLIIAYRVG